MKTSTIILLVIAVIAVIVIIAVIVKIHNAKKMKNKIKKGIKNISGTAKKAYGAYDKYKAEREEISKRLGAVLSGTLRLDSGLPFAKNALVDIYYCPERIVFRNSGKEISIDKDKIKDINYSVTEAITKDSLKSSISDNKSIKKKASALVNNVQNASTTLTIAYSDDDDKEVLITFSTYLNNTFIKNLEGVFKENTEFANDSDDETPCINEQTDSD